MKTCTKCQEVKAFEFFCKDKKTKDGLNLWCKACANKYRAENKAKLNQYFKDYRQLNASRIAKVQTEYRQKNKETIKTKKAEYDLLNKDKAKARTDRFRENNKGKLNAWTRMRQAKKLQRTPHWLTEFDKIHMRCLYQVAVMRTKESGEEWQVDHKIPLNGKNVSGLHVPTNLQVIRANENYQKSNKFKV